MAATQNPTYPQNVPMKGKAHNTDSPVLQYCLQRSNRLSPIQMRLQEESTNIHYMTASADVIQHNMFLAQSIGAKKALEIGLFNGCNALGVALALPADGVVYGFDVDDAPFKAVGEKYFREADVEHKLKMMVGPALQHLDALIAEGQNGTFDFAFIDADKDNYDNYYERCLILLRKGGIIAIDNVLWSGRVIDYVPGMFAGDNHLERSTAALWAITKKIHEDQRVNCSMLPIGDGLMLALKL